MKCFNIIEAFTLIVPLEHFDSANGNKIGSPGMSWAGEGCSKIPTEATVKYLPPRRE